MIQILDLKKQYLSIEKEIDAAIKEVLLGTNFINGEQVVNFEKAICNFCSSNYAVGLNSGTDALLLALRSCNIGKGDEVITTPFTFIATTEVIELASATPVFVDIDPLTFNIDVNKIEEKITDKTKAIMPVHLFGQACEMDKIQSLAKAYNLRIIEDCAQSIGGKYKGTQLGTIGDIGCFSFFPSKNLGAYGDAGMLISNNKELADKARVLRQHGAWVKYYHEELGLNSRLDTLQAAILNVKLKYLNDWTEKRRKVAENYNEALKELKNVVTPNDNPNSYSVYHQYTIRVLDGKRKELQSFLKDNGVQTMIYYPVPLHLQKVHAHLNLKEGDFIHSEQAANEVLSLPIFPELTKEDQMYVVNKIYEFFK